MTEIPWSADIFLEQQQLSQCRQGSDGKIVLKQEIPHNKQFQYGQIFFLRQSSRKLKQISSGVTVVP